MTDLLQVPADSPDQIMDEVNPTKTILYPENIKCKYGEFSNIIKVTRITLKTYPNLVQHITMLYLTFTPATLI